MKLTGLDASRVHPRQIGAELRRLRQEAGLTQADLAEALGTTQSAVARYESGRHHVTLATICRVAAATRHDVVLAFSGPARTSA